MSSVKANFLNHLVCDNSGCFFFSEKKNQFMPLAKIIIKPYHCFVLNWCMEEQVRIFHSYFREKCMEMTLVKSMEKNE